MENNFENDVCKVLAVTVFCSGACELNMRFVSAQITKKWESSLQKEIPQDLHEMLMQQKSSCDAMIDEKNKLINEFQMVSLALMPWGDHVECSRGFKNPYELLDLRALKFSILYKYHIFQCMGKIFCVEF